MQMLTRVLGDVRKYLSASFCQYFFPKDEKGNSLCWAKKLTFVVYFKLRLLTQLRYHFWHIIVPEFKIGLKSIHNDKMLFRIFSPHPEKLKYLFQYKYPFEIKKLLGICWMKHRIKSDINKKKRLRPYPYVQNFST